MESVGAAELQAVDATRLQDGATASVLPAWRKRTLRDIERLGHSAWVAEKFRQGTGWQIVRNAWMLLSSVLESAVGYGYLQVNPARGVKFLQTALNQKARDDRR